MGCNATQHRGRVAPLQPKVVVVGLGPGDETYLTDHTRSVIAADRPRFLRTVHHPCADVVPNAQSMDDLYDDADLFDEVYQAIRERLTAAAVEHGEVLYAVPGSPLVLERTVEYLRADDRVEVELHPAMSFLDVAWAALGIDPVNAGVRLVDGHRFATEAAGERGPLLVAHCHNQRVMSDIKLSVDEPGDEPVVVLQSLGTADAKIFTVDWWDLDREVDADHLTSIYIPSLASPVGAELQRFVEMIDRLRRECPWDREQTHESLRRHLIEETYEVLEAIDGLAEADDPEAADEHLREELGDLLFQVLIHSAIASQDGRFDIADVAREVHDKLYARHPHVFGSDTVAKADPAVADLLVSWEAAKKDEKSRDSVFDGVAPGLPSLALLAKVQRKAATLGRTSDGSVGFVESAIAGLATESTHESLGVALSAIVAYAVDNGLDAEDAARTIARRIEAEARSVE